MRVNESFRRDYRTFYALDRWYIRICLWGIFFCCSFSSVCGHRNFINFIGLTALPAFYFDDNVGDDDKQWWYKNLMAHTQNSVHCSVVFFWDGKFKVIEFFPLQLSVYPVQCESKYFFNQFRMKKMDIGVPGTYVPGTTIKCLQQKYSIIKNWWPQKQKKRILF